MKALPLTFMAIVSLHACVGSDVDSDDIRIVDQAETIEVHGCRPGWLELGGTCIDPWPGGGGGGGGGVSPGPGPSGGGGGGGPGPKPNRKQCGPEMGEQGCLDCCYYNHDHVDGWECRKKKTPKAQEKCWQEAVNELSRCQVETCNRHGIPPIITIPETR